jgi:hypothetical protein
MNLPINEELEQVLTMNVRNQMVSQIALNIFLQLISARESTGEDYSIGELAKRSFQLATAYMAERAKNMVEVKTPEVRVTVLGGDPCTCSSCQGMTNPSSSST